MGVEQVSSEGIRFVIAYEANAIDRSEQETVNIRFVRLARNSRRRTPNTRSHRFSTEDLVLGAER